MEVWYIHSLKSSKKFHIWLKEEKKRNKEKHMRRRMDAYICNTILTSNGSKRSIHNVLVLKPYRKFGFALWLITNFKVKFCLDLFAKMLITMSWKSKSSSKKNTSLDSNTAGKYMIKIWHNFSIEYETSNKGFTSVKFLSEGLHTNHQSSKYYRENKKINLSFNYNNKDKI